MICAVRVGGVGSSANMFSETRDCSIVLLLLHSILSLMKFVHRRALASQAITFDEKEELIKSLEKGVPPSSLLFQNASVMSSDMS